MPLFHSFPDGSYRAGSATVTGDVTIGAQSSLWFNVVIRGDVAPVRLGQRVNVQDNSVIHVDYGVPNVIEDDVIIGHGALIHGQRVGRGSLVGMGAILLSRSQIGEKCMIAAGAVVAPDTIVPDRHLAMGTPARVVRPVTDEELEHMARITAHYAELARRYVAGEFKQYTP